MDTKTNTVIDGQHINKSLRIHKDLKHFEFNNTNYLIMDKEDKSLNENYRGVLDNTQQNLLEKELNQFNNKL